MEENKENSNRWENWKEKLATTYRLVIINDDSFEEVNNTKLTLANLYTIASSIFVAMALLVFLLIIFTPLKQFIPGYGDFNAEQKAEELAIKIEALETEVASYKLWSQGIKNIMIGKVDTTGTSRQTEMPVSIQDRTLNVDKIPEDQDLRIAIDEEINEPTPTVVNLAAKEKPLEQLFFTPPVTGSVTLPFLPDKNHYGVDITSPKNTPIKSVMSGFVIASDWTLETGNTICIQHSDNLVSFYKHNSVLLKKVGDLVNAGEAIAIIKQIWGALLGAFLGLFLLLSAIQLYHDIRSLTEGKGEDRFVLINKKVNIFNTLGATSAFTEAEMDTLLQQDFINGVGKFTPNKFKVSASSSMMGFYTELFFEAIEDDYLDIHPRKFRWKDGQQEIPVIISRDYLALYNFGFAPSQGLPQFTQNTIKKVSVDVTIKGKVVELLDLVIGLILF